MSARHTSTVGWAGASSLKSSDTNTHTPGPASGALARQCQPRSRGTERRRHCRVATRYQAVPLLRAAPRHVAALATKSSVSTHTHANTHTHTQTHTHTHTHTHTQKTRAHAHQQTPIQAAPAQRTSPHQVSTATVGSTPALTSHRTALTQFSAHAAAIALPPSCTCATRQPCPQRRSTADTRRARSTHNREIGAPLRNEPPRDVEMPLKACHVQGIVLVLGEDHTQRPSMVSEARAATPLSHHTCPSGKRDGSTPTSATSHRTISRLPWRHAHDSDVTSYVPPSVWNVRHTRPRAVSATTAPPTGTTATQALAGVSTSQLRTHFLQSRVRTGH
jgi:hypothetical protein